MRFLRRGAGADEELTAELEQELADVDAPPDVDDEAPEPRPEPGPEPDATATGPGPAADVEGLAGLVAATARTGPGANAGPPPTSKAAAAPTARRSRRAQPSRPAPAPPPDLDFEPDVGPDPFAEGRPAALRIAGLHLRTGQHALARAELEALAGRGRLDEDALLDLAEVRWRTGDLSGAGDAANALLALGAEPLLALVIAAEAVSAAGRPGEARRLSTRALEVAGGPLDPLFAGMPRAMVWPAAGPDAASPEPRRRGRRSAADSAGAPSTAAEAFAGGRAALARGDANRAGLLLSVAMRLEPGFAADVLRAVAGRDDQPLLALVRGDALRLLGRELEALEAFGRARGRSSAAAASRPPAGGPGLFDDDPAVSDDGRP